MDKVEARKVVLKSSERGRGVDLSYHEAIGYEFYRVVCTMKISVVALEMTREWLVTVQIILRGNRRVYTVLV